jgi:hypothetical protein
VKFESFGKPRILEIETMVVNGKDLNIKQD